MARELSPREREVIELMAEGLSNAEIAARLGLAEATVKDHVGAILRKLDSPNRAGAVGAWLRSPPRAEATRRLRLNGRIARASGGWNPLTNDAASRRRAG